MSTINIFSLFLFLLSFSTISRGQNDLKSILNNPDITWVAEAYTNYVPSANSLKVGKEQMKALYQVEERNVARPLKIVDLLSDDNLYGEPMNLSTLMLNVDASKVSIYKTADLEKKYSKEEYEDATTTVDTIITFDPDTYEEIVQVVVSDFDERDVNVFKVKQIIYYNSKTKQLGAFPVAIAPMLSLRNNRGKVVRHSPLFWLKVNDIQNQLDLTKNAYNYALRMTRTIQTQDMAVVKGKGGLKDIVGDMFAHSKKKPEEANLYHRKAIYYRTAYIQAMMAEEIASLGTSVDTIITFDPETFEEIVQVASNRFEDKEVGAIRLVQDWAWNSSKQQLYIRLIAYAPMLYPNNSKAAERKLTPFFYKKP